MRRWGEARRFIDAGISRMAAEVKARSSLELGHDGLAQRSGMRTPDALVSSVTGTSGPEARTMVVVGEMMEAPSPWLAEVADGVGAGRCVGRSRRRDPAGARVCPRRMSPRMIWRMPPTSS